MKKDERQNDSPGQEAGRREPQRALQPAPGKVTRTSRLSSSRGPAVQRKAAGAAPGSRGPVRSAWDHTMDSWMDAAHRGCTALAEQGQEPVQAREDVASQPLGAFPHAGVIARGMGVSPAGRAIVDPEGCAASGVDAFTQGDTTHFATEAPPLRVAAHEAAHQAQHAGLTRDGGMGAERHADAIATSVAAGDSAAHLLGSQGTTVDAGFHAYTEFDVAAQTSGSSSGWKDPAGQPLKVTDDGKAALSDAGYGSAQLAWALPADIAKSEQILQAQRSKVKLSAGAVDISGKKPGSRAGTTRSLARIVIEDRAGAAATTLTDDCGTAMHESMGSSSHGNEGQAAIKNGNNEEYTSKRSYHGGYGGAPNNTTPELWFEEILAKHFGPGRPARSTTRSTAR